MKSTPFKVSKRFAADFIVHGLAQDHPVRHLPGPMVPFLSVPLYLLRSQAVEFPTLPLILVSFVGALPQSVFDCLCRLKALPVYGYK